jgi:micrococcal nuclease
VRLLLLLASVCAYGESFTGKVVAVADGDSISVMRGGRAEAVRLNGIDAPERGQPFANAAKQQLSELVFGKVVRVEIRTKDRYQRTVADVYVGATLVNHELVRTGMAWWFRQYARGDRRLRALEEEAREAKRGLWEEAEPVAPWEFRRRR